MHDFIKSPQKKEEKHYATLARVSDQNVQLIAVQMLFYEPRRHINYSVFPSICCGAFGFIDSCLRWIKMPEVFKKLELSCE